MPSRHVRARCKSDGACGRCNFCNLAVCAVCGAYEGSLTSDCPGAMVDFDKQQEVYTTDLDYTDEKGWHNTGAKKGGMNGWPRVVFRAEAGVGEK